MGRAPEERFSWSTYEALHTTGDPEDDLPLVLLHGSNGGERDLLGLAAEVRPGASHLAISGDVAMHPGFAYFRRLPDRRVDVTDLRARARQIARLLDHAAARFHWRRKPIAIGYSNGAIMATVLLLDAPASLAGAVLLRPLLPFEPAQDPTLAGKPVLIVDGAGDARRDPGDGLRLSEALRRGGAVVQRETSVTGHALGRDDVVTIRAWLNRRDLPGTPTRSAVCTCRRTEER